jgi:nucleoside phosphorylase
MEDFSTFLAARKVRDRTDQYLILAALYCAGRNAAAVSSREISDILKLHLRTKAPDHIQTRLREYSAYVRIASEGPPLRWALKDTGVQRLRDLSGLTLEDAAEKPEFGTDVGIVCALEQPEFAAVEEAFGGPDNWKPVGDARFAHLYRSCIFQTEQGDNLNLVGTTSTSMGLTAASIVTTQLIMQFRPRIVMMIGIAAGTRDGGKEFGDVLVADPSVDYNSGKVVWSNGVRGFLPDPYPIGLNPRLRSVLLRFQGSNQVFREIRDGWNGPLPDTLNRMHLGPVGASDQVIDDASRILEIQRNWRKLIGVEMETYGVYRACHESPDPKPRFVSFKSVCDFAAEKSDSWQDYAAYVAAQFAARFLRSQWQSLWSNPSTTGGKQ